MDKTSWTDSTIVSPYLSLSAGASRGTSCISLLDEIESLFRKI